MWFKLDMYKRTMQINLTEQDLIHQRLDTIEAFYSSIKAEPTKKLYTYLLTKFLDSCGKHTRNLKNQILLVKFVSCSKIEHQLCMILDLKSI